MPIHKLVFVVEMINAAEQKPIKKGLYFVCAKYAVENGLQPEAVEHFEEWYWDGAQWADNWDGEKIVPFVILFWGPKIQAKNYRTMYRDANDVISKVATNARDD